MNYIAERRLEEKERRRAEILDAAEAVAAAVGWDDMTMDQVARKARLSRALLYVYFKDKNDLMFGLNERALVLLKQKFTEARAGHERGMDQLVGMGRAYVALSQEFPLYFNVLARCELRSVGEVDPTTNEGICLMCGNEVLNLMVSGIETGIRDGSVRADSGPSDLIAVSLWGFMHGIIQVATNKASMLVHRGVGAGALIEQAIQLCTRSLAPAT